MVSASYFIARGLWPFDNTHNPSVVAALSGPGGSTYRTYDASNGTLILEKRLHSPEVGHLSEPHHLGKFVAFSPDGPDAYVLTNGHTISKIDNNTGKIKWTWSSEDKTCVMSCFLNMRLLKLLTLLIVPLLSTQK